MRLTFFLGFFGVRFKLCAQGERIFGGIFLLEQCARVCDFEIVFSFAAAAFFLLSFK